MKKIISPSKIVYNIKEDDVISCKHELKKTTGYNNVDEMLDEIKTLNIGGMIDIQLDYERKQIFIFKGNDIIILITNIKEMY